MPGFLSFYRDRATIEINEGAGLALNLAKSSGRKQDCIVGGGTKAD